MGNVVYGSTGNVADARALLEPIAPDLYRAHRAAVKAAPGRAVKGLAYSAAELAAMVSAATDTELEAEAVSEALTISRSVNRGGGVTELVAAPFRFGPFNVKRYGDAFAFIAVSPVPEAEAES